MKLKYTSTSLQCVAFSLLTFSLSSAVRAETQVKHPIKPFLWKVEGKGLTKPAHLFGTIHVSDPSVTTLHPAAQKAFDTAECFYAEIDMRPELQMAMLPLIRRQDGKALDDSIGVGLAAKLNAELVRINPQLNSATFQTMKTWLVATLPELLPDQLAGKKPLDLQLWEAATTGSKKTAGLEEIEAQLKGFNALTEAEQISFMKASLEQLERDRKVKGSIKSRLIKAYISGDKNVLLTEIHASMIEMKKGGDALLGEKLWNTILVERDKTISESIINSLKAAPSKSHFFAVGAAHYCTEKSILHHVREAGYTVTRIEK